MEMNKEKLLYRIFKEDAQDREMDMKEFYHKRRRGLLPFLNSKGEVVWLKRKEFRIATVRRIDYIKKSKKSKYHRHSHHHEDADFTGPITPEMAKYFFFGAVAVVSAYLFVKFIEFLVSL